MRRFSLPILLLVALVNFAVFAFMNRPVEPPPWEGMIAGVSFAPYREGQGPIDKVFPTREQIREDLRHVAPHTRSVRTLHRRSTAWTRFPRLASEFGLTVTAGAWLDGDKKKNEREIKSLLASARANPNVTRVIVGNEVLLRGDLKTPPARRLPAPRARAARRSRSAPPSRGTSG